MKRHISGTALVLTFVGLLVLTAASWLISLVHLGTAELPVALAIAALKAGLVILFFMHLIEEEMSTTLAVLAALFFVLLLATFVAAEVATRSPIFV
jgi:cytochrome c oxidase subunit 4